MLSVIRIERKQLLYRSALVICIVKRNIRRIFNRGNLRF